MAIEPKKINFDVAIKSTNHTRSYALPPEVYTSDDNAVQFRFNILDVTPEEFVEGAAVSTIEITTRDGSIFQKVGETALEDTTIVYDLKENEGNHAGLAKIQLVLQLGTKKFTSDEYEFKIINNIANAVPVEIYVQNWGTLTSQAEAYITQMAQDIEEFDVALETGVLATNIEAKLLELSTTFAPDLTTLKADMVQAKADILLNNRGLGTTYDTLALLQAAFPTGDTYDHIVALDGHRYFWNGTVWADGGAYQAIESNAEVKDGRLDGYGTLYPDLGGSIRAQVSDTKDQIQIAIENGYSLTHTRLSLFEKGGINSSGLNITDSRYIRTKDFLPSTVTKVVMITGSVYSFMVLKYDMSGVFVSRVMALKSATLDTVGFKYRVVVYHTDNASILDYKVHYKHIVLAEAASVLPYALKTEVSPEMANLQSDVADLVSGKKFVDGALTPKKTSFLRTGKNLLDSSKITYGYFIDFSTGAPSANVSFGISPPMEVSAGARVTTNHHYSVAFYDEDNVHFSGINSSAADTDNYTLVPGEIQGMGLPAVYTVPAGARWMIQTILPGWADSTQIEIGEAPTAYEPYKLFIDGFYYPEAAVPAAADANTFVKVGDVCTITMGKARYKLVKQNNSGRALNTWRLYQGDIVDDTGTVVHNLWVDSDGEGAIKEQGAADFIGGFHGDETYNSVDIMINGKSIVVANDLDTTFDTLDIYVTSKLYHCATVIEAFDRVKHLSFANNTYTCRNKFTTLSPFIVDTAALALFNCYKQYNGVDKIYKFTDNYKRTLELVPQGTSTDGGIYNSAKLDTGTIYGDGFIITIKYLDEKLPEYGGIWTDFGTQNRIKLYLHTIAAPRTLSVNEILTSMFSVTIE